MKKSLLEASFEESLNLEDDPFIQYLVNDTNSRKIYTKPFSNLRKILSVFFILFMLMLSLISENPSKLIEVDYWKVNLLPSWLYLICWIVWWILSRKNLHEKYISKTPFVSIRNSTISMCWMVLYLNLFIIRFAGKSITIYGTVLFYVIIFTIFLKLVKYQYNELRDLLFGIKGETEDKKSLFMQYLPELGGFVVILWFVFRFIFPDQAQTPSGTAGALMMLLLLFVINIVVSGGVVFLFFPYLLYGHYRHKYSEEYRKWEGKSLEEWYGKKYLEKHKELLENE